MIKAEDAKELSLDNGRSLRHERMYEWIKEIERRIQFSVDCGLLCTSFLTIQYDISTTVKEVTDMLKSYGYTIIYRSDYITIRWAND